MEDNITLIANVKKKLKKRGKEENGEREKKTKIIKNIVHKSCIFQKIRDRDLFFIRKCVCERGC